MIDAIANLINQAGASQVQLTIRTDGNNNVSVVVNTSISPMQPAESKQAQNLRAALSQPLVISGDIGEVDVSFTEALINFTETFVVGSIAHNNLVNAKSVIESATKKVTGNKKTASKSQSAKPSSPLASTSKSVSNTTSVVSETSELPNSATFLSGDADSL